ncbi:MAG: sulfatase-like hydrolase/transferase [Luteitalea sp.]|nr:sulfatase-like hydrolase/transferase [Luteitalea sp.]
MALATLTGSRRVPTLILALVVLNASLTFENLWPTPWVRLGSSISVELAALLLIVCGVAWRIGQVSPNASRALAGIWFLLVVGRYAQVTVPALYGQEVNLYWDLRYVPDVIGMGVRVAPVWLVVLAAAAGGISIALVLAVALWAIRQVAWAAACRRARPVLVSVSGAVVLAFGAQSWSDRVPDVIASPVTQTYARQFGLVAEALRPVEAIADSPAMETSLAAVKEADVFLVFIEAYGAVSFDRPAFAERLVASRSRLIADIHDTGREVVSAFVESPTFGGSSWLAHLSLMSGVEVRNQDTKSRLMAESRHTLVHVFRNHGYRTLALMPGLRHIWPEGAFYDFEEIYGATRLDYRGPEFGWFAVPDQFTLERLDRLEVRQTSRAPLFVFFPTISTHFPFSPTPPYQPDWRRLDSAEPFDVPDLVSAYSEQPDWTDFGPGYARALSYDFASLGGYLRRHSARDLVMILIGDHQPAAAVSGEGDPWDVPVHVVSSRANLIDRLELRGFRRGLTPQRPRLTSMAGLLPILLNAFGG